VELYLNTLCVFVTWCLVKRRHNFTLTYREWILFRIKGNADDFFFFRDVNLKLIGMLEHKNLFKRESFAYFLYVLCFFRLLF